MVAQLLPEFEREHPGVHVRVQQLPWTAAHEKLLTAFVGDSTPDIAQLGNTWIPEFAELGAIAPLDARVAASPAVPREDYFPGIWESNFVDGTQFGVPWYVDTRVLFYRADLVRRAGCPDPPRTWARWEQCLAGVKRVAGAGNYAILLPLNEFAPLTALALQQDDPILADGGRRGNFRSPGFRRALSFYVSLFDQGLAPTATDTQISNVWDEFGKGYFSYYVSGPWNIGEFRRRLPPSLQQDWRTAPLPGPTGPGTSVAGGSSLVVFRASRHPEAAWQLVEYLSRIDVQERFRQLTGDLPPRRSAWDAPVLAADREAHAFREQLERVRPMPRVPEWEHIADEIQIVSSLAVHGRLSVEEAAAELDRRVDAMLEKRRWMLARRRSAP